MTTPPRLRVRSLLAGLLLTATVGAVAMTVDAVTDPGAAGDAPAPTRPVTAGSGR